MLAVFQNGKELFNNLIKIIQEERPKDNEDNS